MLQVSHRHFPKLRIHPFAISGLFLLLFSMPQTYTFAVLTSVILHETGHLTAALLCGKRPEYIKIMPTGISIGLPSASSYKEEVTIAAAGPLMNLLYCAASPLLPLTAAESVKAVSLLLCLLNLLPITSFDGGKILEASLAFFLGEALAERILQITTAACLCCLWILSLYVFFYSGINMTLLIFCAYLFSYLIAKKL